MGKNIINWEENQENNMLNVIYEELKNIIPIEKEKDLKYITNKYSGKDLENQKIYLDEDYKNTINKLRYIKEIEEKDELEIKRYIRMIALIDSKSDINVGQKLMMMLSYSSLINSFPKISEKTEEEVFIISACSIDLEEDEYDEYIGILVEGDILKNIILKTPIFGERASIALKAMEALSTEYNDGLDLVEDFDELVETAEAVVNNYKVSGNDNKKRT